MNQSEKKEAQVFIDKLLKDILQCSFDKNILLNLEEKILLSQLQLDNLHADQCYEADRNVLNVAIYCNMDKGKLFNDVNWLIQYINEGNAISGYFFSIQRIFSNKSLKSRLYVIDEVYIAGHPCDNMESLLLLQNILRTEYILERVSDLWGIRCGNFECYTQGYNLLNYLLLRVIDVVQDQNLASLALENIKFDLERYAL